MRHAIDSALPEDERIEILIIDDGSSDATGQIADEYSQRFPDSVRSVHQPNKGHGGAVMTGIREAGGIFLKILDSDDWLDENAFPKLLSALEKAADADLVISNYIYDKAGAAHPHRVHYENALPVDTLFTWKQIGRFHEGQYLLMHALTYKCELLRSCGLNLPEHTFYVDNLYAYVPLTSVKTMYYVNEDVYHYYIGREDQSVHESVMIRRIDQQISVNRQMVRDVDLTSLPEEKMMKYMRNYLEIITAISSVLLIRSGTPENLEKKKALWEEIRRDYPGNYHLLRTRPLSAAVLLPGKINRKILMRMYGIAQKIYGFN